MTRKDYVLIAKSLKSSWQDIQGMNAIMEKDAYAHVCENIASALKADNMRFDRERFVTACGVDYQN